ncbi:hypothetical protein APHAL10511_004772 [Amanita phalloides]|nr:hypothetical protein APHAL10511_004772 [Amanita phalloides]
MHISTVIVIALGFIASVAAERVIIVNVGGNTTEDAAKVFQPQSVNADQGDVVYFNFTQGNHTVTQSLFNSPCLATYVSNYTINGFVSGFRDAGDGSTYSNLLITILDPNTPIWFFDYNTCAQGGVGVINPNSTQTLQEFQDRAMTINGTGPTRGASATSSSAAPDKTRASSGATQPIAASAVVLLAVLALSFSLLS